MNDATTPPPDEPTGDELVSAVLDGEATEEQVAVVSSDPALAARLASFRSVQAAVRAPAIGDEDELAPAADVRIAAALAADGHDAPADPDDAPERAPSADVRPFPVARRRRLSIVGGVAAALVLVAAAVGLGLRAGDRSDDSASGSADLAEHSEAAPSADDGSGADRDAPATTTSAPAFGDSEQRASAPASGAAAASSGGDVGPPDLGTIDDPSQLRAAVGDPTRLVLRAPAELPCPLLPSEQWVRIGTVLLDGRPVLVAVAADDGELRAAYLDTCAAVG